MRCSFLPGISTETVVQGEQWNELVRMGTRFHLSCSHFNSFAHVNRKLRCSNRSGVTGHPSTPHAPHG
jgi:hypothetical protein